MKRLALCLLTLLTSTACSQTTRTNRVSTLTAPDSIKPLMLKTFNYQVAEQAKKKPDGGWIRAAFYTGVMAAYRATHVPVYLEQTLDWAAHQGHYAPHKGDWRFADNYCNAQVYCELYQLKHDPRMIAASRANFDRILANPKPGRVDWWWCDSLYMGPPGFFRMSAVTGDPKYANRADEMYWDAVDYLYRPNYQLFFRDKNYFHAKAANGQPVFWSRGNGWVHAGLARILQYLPANYPSRPKYVELFKDMSEKLIALQGKDGLWRSSLLDPAEFPEPETSGSAFFTFGLAWGVNNHLLDRDTYLPHVLRGYAGLRALITPEGRLTHVQRVAGAPGKVNPNDTHEYAVGAFLQASAELLKLHPTPAEESAALQDYHPPTLSLDAEAASQPRATGVSPAPLLLSDSPPTSYKLDFGTPNSPSPDYTPITPSTAFSPTQGFGWLDSPHLDTRDRGGPTPLLRNYVFGHDPATLRLSLPPGTYRLTLTAGDLNFGDHVLQPKLNVPDLTLPTLSPSLGEYLTLTTAFDLKSDHLDLTLDSPAHNWVLNTLTIEPAKETSPPKVTSQQFARTVTSTWPAHLPPDGIKPYVDAFRAQLGTRNSELGTISPTHLTRADYLKLIAGNVDFWKQHQDARGAIIDPYRKVEFQYSTPCFALSAATLIHYANRSDLLDAAARAMDWATQCLHDRNAATHHEDFYAPTLAHALPLLKPHVTPERAAKWEQNLRTFDPFKIYRAQPGTSNWNVVASSGEALFHLEGLRPDPAFTEASYAGQGDTFNNPFGLYTEGPMPYDHFPRLWAADAIVAAGYHGKYTNLLAEQLRRAALTSLFMQSPTGELPTGGRSSHHQWNEAEQCVTYEIFANYYHQKGDTQLASVFKRAAHLALSSIQRWQRPTGELQVLKNWFDPKDFFAYEGYTSHSQYNLLTMAMLAIAYERAQPTESLHELPAPADVGGFVLDLTHILHKVFANAAGTYVEIDTGADPHYNATGLIRIHRSNVNPQLGPSDALTATPASHYPDNLPRTTAAVGVEWQLPDGSWQRLAQFAGPQFVHADDAKSAAPPTITSATLSDTQASPQKVTFTLTYNGNFQGPSSVVERYTLTPGTVSLSTSLPGYTGPLAMTYPALADDGLHHTLISTTDHNILHLALNDSSLTITSPDSRTVDLPDTLYPSRNGLYRLATFPQPNGSTASLTITLQHQK